MLQQPRSQEEAPCTRTQEVPWETLLNKGIKPIQIISILFKRNTSTKINPSTQEGASNPRTLAPKRGAHLLPKKCTCWNFQTDKKDIIPQWGISLYLY